MDQPRLCTRRYHTHFPGRRRPPNPPALDFDKTYFFQVRGKAGTETGEASDVSDGAYHRAVTKPAKLTGVTATAGNAQVTLSWDAPPSADNVFNYDYRIDPHPSGGSSGWTLWQNFTTSTNSHTVTGLTNGSTYSFQVRANNNIGPGTASEVVTATPAGPPAAPDLSAKVGDQKVTLTWGDAGDLNIDRYQDRYKVAGADAWEQDWADVADIDIGGGFTVLATGKEVTGLTNGEGYTFEVRAVSNANGAGAAASINATPQEGETAPGLMLGVDHTVTGVTGGSGGTVVFTWNDPGDDSINKYQYRYDGSSNTPESWDRDWTDIPGTNNNKDLTTWSVGIHGTSTNVFYELRAVNDPTGNEFLPGPETAISVDRSNTPVSTPSPPDAPSIYSPTTSSEQVEASWIYKNETQNTAITKQQHRQSEDGGDTWTDWTDLTSSAWSDGTNEDGDRGFSHTFGSLTNGVTYTFEVRAVSTHGNGGTSTFTTTPGQPGSPFGLTVATEDDTTTAEVNEAPTQTTLHLSWTAPTGGIAATGYDYRQRVSGAGEWGPWIIIQGDGTTTTFTAGGLAPGALYRFQVRAVAGDSRIPSDFAETASGTTVNPPAPNKPENLVATGVIGGARLGWDRVTRGDARTEDDTVSVYSYQLTTSAQVTLSWEDPGNSAITIWQYRQSDTEAGLATATWTDIGSSNADTTTHTVTGLNAGGTHFFEVRPFTSTELGAVEITTEASGDFTGVTQWTAFSNEFNSVEGTVTGLADDTHYLRIQAENPGGTSPASDSVLATPKIPDNGTWTYQVVVNPNRILPDSGEKAEVSLVATWRASSSDRPDITTLSVNGTGSVLAEVDASDPPPQVVGFGTSSTVALSTTSFAASPPGNCVTAIEAGTITCTLHITSRNTDLYAASGARGTYNVYVRPGAGFSLEAVVNRIETDASEPANDDIPTGSLNVARPPAPPPQPQPPATPAPTEPPPTVPPTEPPPTAPPTAPPTEPPPTAPPQGRTVTESNPAETVTTTVDKPPLVLIALLVDTESCGAESPQGSLSLCLEIDATGPTEMLEDDPALITIHLSASRWSALRNAYLNGQFWVFKRSDAAAAWADIPACLNGATDECYEVTEYRNKSATVTIRNVRSLSQYAIAAVPPRSGGSGGGGSGGGSGTGSGGGSLARVTGTPAPTVPVIVPPTVRPTAVIPTPQPTVPPTPVPPTAIPPTAVPPTVVPSTAAPPTAVPPTPTEAPTPPVQVEAPTPPPPTPVDAPTLEPTEVTAALPPTAVAPAPTPIPPLVGEPEGNLPPWLLIVIIAAVLVVGGMGFLAFRLLRAQ